MSDLIRRSDAIGAVWGEDINPSEDGMIFEAQSHIDRDIRLIPSADRPQGEWIYGEHNVAMCDGYRCNRCDFFVPWDNEYKFIDFINIFHFCPNCGSRMKGADDE